MTESDYNKVVKGFAEVSRLKHRYYMFRNLFAAAIFGVMAIGLVYARVTQSASNSTSILLIIGAALSGLYTFGAIFEAGRESAKKFSESYILEKEAQYQKLSKDFNEDRKQYREGWGDDWEERIRLVAFLREKSPDLLKEFMALREKQRQQLEVEESK